MIPLPSVWAVVISAVLSALVAASAAWVVRGWQAGHEVAELKAAYAQERERQAKVHARDLVAVINRGDALAAVAEKDAQDARTQAAAARRTVADLRAESDQLRQHVFRLAAATAAPGEPATATAGSAPAAGPGLVLANLWGGAEGEAIELGPALDEARARGLRCERAYDRAREALAAMNEVTR